MDRLIAEMMEFGLEIDGRVELDGEFHRCGFRGSRDKRGFYAGRLVNGKIYCTYGTWDDRDSDRKFTDNGIDSVTADRTFRLLAIEREMRRRKLWAKAAQRARNIVRQARPCPDDHPYIRAKGIRPDGVLVDGKNRIVVLLIDDNGEISTVQTIAPDGSKKLMFGGRKKGCCHVIPGDDEVICVCEGWATGKSIHEATGYKVLVAIDVGNMEVVVRKACNMFPDSKVLVCADNDHAKEKNVGLERGRGIAASTRAGLRYPQGIQGTDFNDMAMEKGLDAVRQAIVEPHDDKDGDDDGQERAVKVMSASKIQASTNMTLDIPEHIMRPGGLISLGMEALSAPGMPGISQYAFPVVVSAIARAISGKITCQGVWPNIYSIKVGPTSSGKTITDREIKLAMKHAGFEDFCTMTDFASGQALYRGLERHPRTMIMIDEATEIFKAVGEGDPVAAGKRNALLELYSASGESVRKEYANSSNSISINNVCLTMLGNATMDIIEAMTMDDFHTGIIPRVDFYCYDGKIPYRGIREDANGKLDEFSAGVSAIHDTQVSKGNLGNVLGLPVETGLTPDAAKLLERHSRAVTDMANDNDDTRRGVVSRMYDLAIKYALIHAGAIRPPEQLTGPLTVDDLQWGIDVAAMLVDWKMNKLLGRITTGDYHRDCELFKDAVAAAVKTGARPTFSLLANRRVKLKNWPKKHLDTIVEMLLDRGEIIIDSSKRKPAYFLVENTCLHE